MSVAAPKIKIFTHHGCGWCHRVHITLKELGLEYEEVHVDLGQARPQWFLDLNPRGLVPVFQYTASPTSPTLTLTESGPIVSFLTDLHASHLLPSVAPPFTSTSSSSSITTAVSAAHLRWRMSFFTDAYFSKVNPLMFKLVAADRGAPQAKVIDDIIGMLEKEIEPLLVDAEPYFAGSQEFTVVEAMTTPFTLRLYDFSNDTIFPAALGERMRGATLPHFSRWMDRCMAHPSVTYVYHREALLEGVTARLGEAKIKYAAKD